MSALVTGPWFVPQLSKKMIFCKENVINLGVAVRGGREGGEGGEIELIYLC